MSGAPVTVRMIRVDTITVLNPRARNKRVFKELVTSIANLGLKKPITVSERPGRPGYDLVCGQGRLEAFIALGQKEIPAVIIEASEEDCYVKSLVENLARRQHSSLELMREIGALKERGYSVEEIAPKVDLSSEYVAATCHLLENGEHRLLAAIDRGMMPPSIAMEIVRAQERDVQQALAEAYEKKMLPGNMLLTIRKIIAERNQMGPGLRSLGNGRKSRGPATPTKLVRSYMKETDRQKLMVKKADLAKNRLIFVVNAMRRLLADEHFVTLLRAEGLRTMPGPLAERIEASGG